MPSALPRSFAASAALFLASAAAHAAPVLMISIDGLKPEYITQAQQHGQRFPVLESFLHDGVYADGVIPVLPSVTYPDHTTLITGVWPAQHGIYNNPLFDPEQKFSGAWYWYAESIKVPTLWDAAHQAGIHTASVSWPVSVGATSVDTLIPEYWRSSSPAAPDNPQDTYLMNAISRPDGMLETMEQRLGPYMAGNDTTVGGDRTRTKFSLDIIEHQHPGFMTIHLSSLDESEHLAGPFSKEADDTLSAVDGMVGQLIAAERVAHPDAAIVIVSDHGFAEVHHLLNLAVPFVQAGLITYKDAPAGGKPAIASWKAQPWSASGMAAVMLHDPSDSAAREQVRTLLEKLAADPANGIAKILDKAEVAKFGGFPDAGFVVALKPGYALGTATSGPITAPVDPVRGTHGYLPTFAEMHASFFAEGPNVAHGRDLGVIDMRRIAPTVAGLLGVSLPTATQPVLPVTP